MLCAPDIPSRRSLPVNKRKGSANYARQSHTAASQLGGVSVLELELVEAGSPTSFSPPTSTPTPVLRDYLGGGWAPTPGQGSRCCDTAHHHPPSASASRAKTRGSGGTRHPAPCLKVGGRGRGGPYDWTLQLTQEVQGEPGTGLGIRPACRS